MTEQELIDRLTNNERAFYFLSDEEKDFMRNWPHGLIVLTMLNEHHGILAKPGVNIKHLFPDTVYRLNPAPRTPLNLPWEWINDRYQWAAMDEGGKVYMHENEPSVAGNGWLKWGSAFYLNCFLKIDTTGINWRTSLTKRPEASE